MGCQKKLDIKRPSYDTLNRLIAKAVSSMTASLRFAGELNVDLNEFQTNLVPFPRLHFMITSMAPVTTRKKAETTNCEIQPITEQCFSAQNFFAKIADFDAEEDKYMAVSVNYRGAVKAKKANATVQWMKTNKKVTFVHWYVGEGMEEGEFAEAREDLGFLEKDYLDVLSEQATDEEDDDDEDGSS